MQLQAFQGAGDVDEGRPASLAEMLKQRAAAREAAAAEAAGITPAENGADDK